MTTENTDNPAESCDLCIVGAGLAGMNALFTASRYLGPRQRIILVDSRTRVGGMWVDTYPYVRLHQPHGMFTAGNIEWTLGREPGYLADKQEVLDHFTHCLDVLKQRVRIDEFFGWTLDSHRSVGGRQQLVCRSGDGRTLTIDAKRLIKAYGADVTPNDPLPLSSTTVHTVSPDSCDVRSDAIAADNAPVWVIGGGKTAMDTVHALVTGSPGREVNLVAGGGTFFLSRDRGFPTGVRRWWTGTPLTMISYQTARRFDGTNEDEVAAWFMDALGTKVTPRADNFVMGILSEAESRTIAGGLKQVVMDYLVDVVDHDGKPELVLRNGARRAAVPGSWVVNCTGYLFQDDAPYEPFASPDGATLSLQGRSVPLPLTSFMAYYLTHLMFLGKLTELPLYEVDLVALSRKSRTAMAFTILTLAQYNLGLIADAVPRRVFTECGLDFDRWYPLPRRIAANVRFLATNHRDRERHRRTLDTVRERFDVRCGPLALDSVAG